ncbi:hypothetical protein WA158_001773 [Blastocystis sp. Blastoise]
MSSSSKAIPDDGILYDAKMDKDKINMQTANNEQLNEEVDKFNPTDNVSSQYYNPKKISFIFFNQIDSNNASNSNKRKIVDVDNPFSSIKSPKLQNKFFSSMSVFSNPPLQVPRTQFYSTPIIRREISAARSISLKESTLLTEDTYNVLSDWLSIEKKWKLIFQASIDGFKAKSFHSICDDKGETLVLVNAKGKNNIPCIFGGYSSVGWGFPQIQAIPGVGWRLDPNAFIFTLKNPHNTGPQKFNVLSEKDAIVQNTVSLACFCSGFYLENDCNRINRSFIGTKSGLYERDSTYGSSLFVDTAGPNDKNFFLVNDIQVFGLDSN